MTQNNPQVSIILPTYNESQNIVNILKLIRENIPKGIYAQTIVVDDNSPDGTGKIVEDYVSSIKKIAENTIDIIHRKTKNGLSSAILNGIQNAKGETIVVMDSDFSHPPQIIPKMIEAFKKYQCDLVVASRYITGGNIQGWTIKRKLMSKIATTIAKKGLGVKTNDPMSGFFAFKKNIIKELNFDALGYKFLLEVLVKTKGVNVKEIPYTFENRKFGSSKLDTNIIIDYFKSVFKLYKYGKISEKQEGRTSIRFLSKAGRFFTVGASGLVINYLVSLLFADGISNLWYIHATIIGIIASMTTNFILNKVWTFSDLNFTITHTIKQYGKFVSFSSIGGLLQIGMVFYLVDIQTLTYPISLIVAVGLAAFGNFILNKKLTFKEKLWN
ncbi:MAG: glycosyltransferase family 2 protein [Nitrosopumilus sp.]|uniref:glycosyltransferase n=1 Tax=Nitrosopumilus sp. TaxID=2024843 RepID=UPI00247C72FE|nr:glycosyltransferase family 2 protein [Nitrosopumilus sp.]MCV0393246.1 glycosyltransferase family 2 protein [Nitrosopumilus sp.]